MVSMTPRVIAYWEPMARSSMRAPSLLTPFRGMPPPSSPSAWLRYRTANKASLTNRTEQQLTHSQSQRALPDAVSESRQREGQSQHLFSVKLSSTSSASTVRSRAVLSTPLRSCVMYPSCRVSYTLSF